MRSFVLTAQVLRRRNGKPVREMKEVRIDAPTDISEISLSTGVELAKLQQRAPKGMDRLATGETVDNATWQNIAAHALEVVHTMALNRDDFDRAALQGLPLAHAGEGAPGLIVLMGSMLDVVARYEPGPRNGFTHGGHEYVFYTDYLDQFNQEWIGRELRVSEAVDALQFEQVFFNRDEDGELIDKDGPYKNDLALLAMLTRRVLPDGTLELPPLDMVGRGEWLDNRMVDLAGVSLDVALDINFFLRASRRSFWRTLLSLLRGRTAPVARPA